MWSVFGVSGAVAHFRKPRDLDLDHGNLSVMFERRVFCGNVYIHVADYHGLIYAIAESDPTDSIVVKPEDWRKLPVVG